MRREREWCPPPRASWYLIAAYLTAALLIGVGDAQAQTPAECSDSTLTTQTPLTSEEAADSTTDLSVALSGVKISATGAAESGISQVHHGEGNITVAVRSSCIETTGTADTSEDAATGILALSTSSTTPATNAGTVTIDVRDSVITTAGPRARGIDGTHTHSGGDIDVSNTSIIS